MIMSTIFFKQLKVTKVVYTKAHCQLFPEFNILIYNNQVAGVTDFVFYVAFESSRLS